MSKKLKNIVRVALTALFLFVMAGTASAQQTIKGTVVDATGEPIIGATVREPNSANGAVTDIDGNFTLTTNSKTVEVSYVGMKTQTINIQGTSTVNVTLQDDSQGLNEVVVVGYGTMRRKDLTGSVATVNSEALQAIPVASATEALAGKMAGVNITTSEGSPDADIKVRVRGGGSITQSNEPLYIVDGFPVETISDIPATDIEDITVLKDASSTAIYGSRGANGVILVTTKSGQAGKVKVSYNAYYSWKKIAKTLDVLSPADYVKWQYEYSQLKGNSDNASQNYTKYFGNYQDIDLYDGMAGNDWQDITFGRIGHTFNQNVNINGGSETIKYAFSYAHMNDKAIMVGSSFKRDNFSLKLNTKPSKRTTLDFQARYSDTDIRGGGANDATSSSDTDKRLKYSVIYTPIPLKNLNADAGTDDDLGNLYHPVTAVWDNDRNKERRTLNMSGAFGWELFKNFKVKTEFGYDQYRQYDQRFYGLTTYYVRNNAKYKNGPAVQLADTNRDRFRNTNTISYDFKKLFGKDSPHSLNVLVGHEFVITKLRTKTDVIEGFPELFQSSDAWKLTTQGTPISVNDFYSNDDKLLSFFGRANYNYMDKYLVSATFRADASSKFAKDNRWGYFPSVALAWRVSSESFMDWSKSWLDDLKLRLSFGTAGNNGIPTGQTVQVFESKNTSWLNTTSTIWSPNMEHMANPDLKWETTITRNLGLDFTLFRSKLTGTIDAYINSTKDLLIEYPTSGSGYNYQYRNIGKTENKGLEFSFTYHAINTKDFGLDFTGNIGFNKSKIKSLGGELTEIILPEGSRWASTEVGVDYKAMLGGAVGKMYGFVFDGRYELSDFQGYDDVNKRWILNEGVADASPVVGNVRPGSMKLKDLDGDFKVTNGDTDKAIIGDANPKATGGFGINARAYGFDLSANFNFSIGNDVYNANKIEFSTTGKYQYRNLLTSMADGKRWTNLDPLTGTISNDPVRLAELNEGTTMFSPYVTQMVFSSWAVEDGSFLRLNTLTLGYTIPAVITNRVGINNLRFYVTGHNLFCITGYSGYDPEVSTMRRNGTNLTPGVDYSAYPKSRQFVIGLNLNF